MSRTPSRPPGEKSFSGSLMRVPDQVVPTRNIEFSGCVIRFSRNDIGSIRKIMYDIIIKFAQKQLIGFIMAVRIGTT